LKYGDSSEEFVLRSAVSYRKQTASKKRSSRPARPARNQNQVLERDRVGSQSR
jgi:hypothetical protein